MPSDTPALDCTPASISVEDALAHIAGAVQPLTRVERVRTHDALHRVLAEPLLAARDLPAWPNAAMDGYACAGTDLESGRRDGLALVGRSLAGRPHPQPLARGQCIRITTGALVPPGADTVVMQEHVRLEGTRVYLPDGVRPGEHVRAPGEDLRAGASALPAGTRLGPLQLGLAAALGQATLAVRPRVRVALFTTGDELHPLDVGAATSDGAAAALPPGSIHDSNLHLLRGLLRRLDAEVLDLGIVPDQPDAVRAAFLTGSAQADVVLSSGGVSVGDADYVREVFEALGRIHFWRIAMKPGRPLAFGRLGQAWFFGLPGNPVSTTVTFLKFVRPALLRLAGEDAAPPLRLAAQLETPLRKAPGRTDYQRGMLMQHTDGTLRVRSAGHQGAHVLSSLARADCLIVLPADCGDLPAGASVQVELLAELV